MPWTTTKTIPMFSGDFFSGTTVEITAEYLDAKGDALLNVRAKEGREIHGISMAALIFEQEEQEFCPW